MNELLSEWNKNNIARPVTVSGDTSLLKVYTGYRSQKEIVCNITLDEIVLNTLHPNLQKDVLANILNNYKPKHTKQYCDEVACNAVTTLKTDKRSKYIPSPFSVSHINPILKLDRDDSEKIHLISEELFTFFEGKGECKFEGLTITGVKDSLEYIVDWNKTFAGLSGIQITQWLLAVKMGTYFNLPTDFRRLEKDKERHNYTNKKINEHPSFQLTNRLVFIGGVKTPDFTQAKDEYRKALINGSNKSRVPYCGFIQALEVSIARLLQRLAEDNVLFLPYSIPCVAPSGGNLQLLWECPLGAVCSELVKQDNPFKKEVSLFLRNVTRSSNIRSCDDIPHEYPSDLTQVLKEYQNGKGYNTAIGFPFTALNEIIERYEQDEPSEVNFNTSFLDNNAARRMKGADQRRKSFELNHAEDVIGKKMLDAMRKYLKNDGSPHKVNGLVCMIDWLREVRNGSFLYNSIDDFSFDMFHDPMNRGVIRKTFREFIEDKKNEANHNHTQWSSVHSFFNKWVTDLSVESGESIPIPISKAQDIFPVSSSSKGVTVREAMPSILHEKCIEVLAEDDYQICSETLPSQKNVKATNQKTGEQEIINNKTVARCLHLLLLLPVRGKQARWLDEGLLDDEIWDFDNGCYIKNEHSLSAFTYPDGKTHTKKFGNTCVFASDSRVGNTTLRLHINTNKTQAKHLVNKGSLGYEIPWPHGTGISQLDDVWVILNKQKKFNDTYMPRNINAIRLDDEEPEIYKEWIRERLPYFVPLFREIKPKASKANPRERFNLAYPISKDNMSKLFKAVMLKAEEKYKEEYPQFKDQQIVKTADGEWLYDIHSLRVYGVTELIEQGMPVEVVQMIVGHAISVMTLYYNKVRAETLKSWLSKAKQRQGISLDNQKQMYKNYKDGKADELIALFDLIEEWRDEGVNDESARKANPDFSSSGVNKIVNGGVCGSFDCDSGGITVVAHKHGKKFDITTTQGGHFRCGNCRYWRSGPRFILEQIYELNVIGEEIRDLRDERINLIQKSHDSRNDDSLKDRHFIAERYDREVDEKGKVLAYRVIELGRRQQMLDASLKKAGVNDGAENQLTITKDLELGIDLNKVPKWETTTKFNACREVETQAAVLGLPISENSVSMRKIEQFVAKALAVSGESRNPFVFMPNDEVKRVALLYAIANSCEKLGREFSDEEFENPALLKKSLGIENMKALVAEPLALVNEQYLLEKD